MLVPLTSPARPPHGRAFAGAKQYFATAPAHPRQLALRSQNSTLRA